MIQITLSTFAPDPYEIIKPIIINIHKQGNQYVGSHFESNCYASGETVFETICLLKDWMLMEFDRLAEKPDGELGPAMIQKKYVLKSLIRRI